MANANLWLALPLHQRPSTSVDQLPNAYLNALALIAHELRSPASVVSGYLRLLQQDSDGLTPRQIKMVDEASRACARALHLLQEIGELATLEGSEPVCAPAGVQVFRICRDALSSGIIPEGGPSPAFICADGDSTALVHGNAAWLTRAFAALMAATAREHGTDALECHGFVSEHGDQPSAVIAFGSSGFASNRDSLVTDRHAFDRWRGGTGLSLPIACRIIEAHGGSVWSPAGAGARTSVWNLPLARISAAGS